MTDERSTARQLRNKISGARTQLKRHAGGKREPELQRYLASLEGQLADLPLEHRLAELDQRWTKMIEEVRGAAIGRPGHHKAEIAKRNAKAKRRANRGLPPLETVNAEQLRIAEDLALELIARRRHEIPALDAAGREIDEAWNLRLELQRRAEQRAGI